MRVATILGGLAALTIVASAKATPEPAKPAPPQPARPVPMNVYTGRWYEIARTPNRINQDCQAGTTDWTPKADGSFDIAAACHKGSPTATPRIIKGSVEVTNPPANTKVRMKLFGGLIARDYWIFDHAADYGWLIMGSPRGDFISIEATRPILAPAVKAEALAHARSLGFDTAKLIFPVQLAR